MIWQECVCVFSVVEEGEVWPRCVPHSEVQMGKNQIFSPISTHLSHADGGIKHHYTAAV